MNDNQAAILCGGLVIIIIIALIQKTSTNTNTNQNDGSYENFRPMLGLYGQPHMKKNNAKNITIIDALNTLQASIDMLCIKTRGRSVNLFNSSFYEHHTFLNLTVEYLQKTSYNISERVKSLQGTANYAVEQIQNLSIIKDAKDLIDTPQKIYQSLISDYEVIAELGQKIFKTSASNGDAGTVALVTGIVNQIEHFAWEIRVMAGKSY
jgi:DNA-binding ferritin-like protein